MIAKKDISQNNTSFNYLAKSSEFLNLVLNNISSCVLLLDSKVELQAYNDALKTIFSNRKNEDLLYVRCGEAIGCAYSIEEVKDCGSTSKCNNCELRIAILESYLNDRDVFKDHIEKPFFDHQGIKTMKHLQFSTRRFIHQQEKYIIMIVDDISKYYY